ncbi:DUF1697 domain-containing protein [Mariniblastus fucicola]|uniref:DUF1697 domain-containing protein n=1 Tax=Mariniblastus fucicola TaxID=980251 RepID=A0A5B9PDH2_9BACT|nr:DUF1697 domain-containing protein [Mariniblastus fucicola]QEG22626.1 hypothetical protein MFFC18_25090 [Mariniblastus fucicola]
MKTVFATVNRLPLDNRNVSSTRNRMTQQIALLRGINVGGKNKVKMADLRDVLSDAGLDDVRTYIQSGSVCFGSRKSRSSLESLIRSCIKDSFGCDVPVMVRPQSFFEDLIAESPYCKSGKPKFDVAELGAVILAKKPTAAKVKSLAEQEFSDEYQILRDVVYFRVHNGFRNTKLNNVLFEKKLGVAATARNWKTICKLVEM